MVSFKASNHVSSKSYDYNSAVTKKYISVIITDPQISQFQPVQQKSGEALYLACCLSLLVGRTLWLGVLKSAGFVVGLDEISQKLECRQYGNVTKTRMSPKQKCHQN